MVSDSCQKCAGSHIFAILLGATSSERYPSLSCPLLINQNDVIKTFGLIEVIIRVREGAIYYV